MTAHHFSRYISLSLSLSLSHRHTHAHGDTKAPLLGPIATCLLLQSLLQQFCVLQQLQQSLSLSLSLSVTTHHHYSLYPKNNKTSHVLVQKRKRVCLRHSSCPFVFLRVFWFNTSQCTDFEQIKLTSQKEKTEQDQIILALSWLPYPVIGLFGWTIHISSFFQ